MRRPTYSCSFLLICAAVLSTCSRTGPPTSSGSPPVEPTAAERVVQEQLEAYNRHDLDAFAATYAPDVRGYRYPDRPLFTGLAELRAMYGRFFMTAPAVRATVVRRIVQGNFVIDHEELTGTPDGRTRRAVAIYEVRDGRITSVRFIQ